MILCPLLTRDDGSIWCVRHLTLHPGPMEAWAREESERAERLRRQWDRLFGVHVGSYRSLPLSAYAACPHRGRVTRTGGCGSPVWACAVHGECSTSLRSGLPMCQRCDHFPPPPSTTP